MHPDQKGYIVYRTGDCKCLIALELNSFVLDLIESPTVSFDLGFFDQKSLKYCK